MKPLFFLLLLGAGLWGCTQTATKEDASVWLTAPETWASKEVTVNSKPVFKDGKVIEQFGEVSFSRYMHVVSFGKDGKFRGSFKGDKKEYIFDWVAADNEVVISDTIPNSGKWRVPYQTLTEKSFDMETETTAFNPPHLTKIRLRFGE